MLPHPLRELFIESDDDGGTERLETAIDGDWRNEEFIHCTFDDLKVSEKIDWNVSLNDIKLNMNWTWHLACKFRVWMNPANSIL